MKKRIVRIVAVLMAMLMLVMSMASCSSGQTMLQLGKQKISLNLYELYLSRQKGTLCTTYYYGSKAKYDEFWQTTISTDGTTYNDYWTSYILQCVKIYLAALYMFEEEYELTLPQSYIDQVEEKLAELVGVSRQAVNDNLTRTEALLKNMEAKTGCVRRDQQCRRAIAEVSEAANLLASHQDPFVTESAHRILRALANVKE